MPELIPVEGNPFAENPAETNADAPIPVEGNPFEAAPPPANTHFSPRGNPTAMPEIDHSELAERAARGSAVSSVFDTLAQIVKEGGQTDIPITGIEPGGDLEKFLIKYGVFRDPSQGRAGDSIRAFNEAVIRTPAEMWELVGRVASIGSTAGGELAGKIEEVLGGSQGEIERARRNAKEFLDIAPIFAGVETPSFGLSRVTRGPTGRLVDDQIGGLAKAEDFDAAASGVRQMVPDVEHRSGAIEAKVQALYEEHGIHPAEVAADASRDPELARDLASNSPMLPRYYTGFDPVNAAKQQMQADLSAGATVPKPPKEIPEALNDALQQRLTWPEMPNPASTSDVPRATPSMRFGDWIGRQIDIIGIGDSTRDLQMKFTPMAARDASIDGRAAAKDFANALRVSRWDWHRVHDELTKTFAPEQLSRMWDAADADNVALLSGKTATAVEKLPAAERYTVQALQARASEAWADAKLAGVVSPDAAGLPSYVPRMIVSDMARGEGVGGYKPFANPQGRNLSTTTPNLKRRQYLTSEETLAAAKDSLGEDAQLVRDIRTLPIVTARLQSAVAGRKLINRIRAMSEIQDEGMPATVLEGGLPETNAAQYFTVDHHPAFQVWKPRFEFNKDTGKYTVAKKEDGTPIMDRAPLYVRKDFEGPLRAVLQEQDGRIYSNLMAIKAKSMSLIMFSPLLHNAVIFGRQFPAMALKTSWRNPFPYIKVYFDGSKAKADAAMMREAISNGFTPIGGHGAVADISSMTEAPSLEPGRSITAKLAAYIPGLFDPAAGVAVKRAIDKAGDVWHNTLLWDRIGDLQAGLYKSYLDEQLGKGIDRTTASRLAAHLANRYAGVLPAEAMSANARKIANILEFSRSFTLGNIGAMKDMLTGLPRETLAQIQRDGGLDELTKIRSYAQRKAVGIVAADMALFYAGNSLLQSGISLLTGHSDLDTEAQGYLERLKAWAESAPHNPFEVFAAPHALTANAENEPGREDRILAGYHADGTAIYARNPTGKVGEEMIGYLTMPAEMAKRKLSPLAKPVLENFYNRDSLGQMIYNPYPHTPTEVVENIARIVGHVMKSMVPYDAGEAVWKLLVAGEPSAKERNIDTMRIIGPLLGVTFSQGAPGGPAAGDYFRYKAENEWKVQQILPEAKEAIKRGDVDGAMEMMAGAHIPPALQRFYISTTQNPSSRFARRAFQQYLETLEPAERARVQAKVDRTHSIVEEGEADNDEN